jgi:hypothetical protein
MEIPERHSRLKINGNQSFWTKDNFIGLLTFQIDNKGQAKLPCWSLTEGASLLSARARNNPGYLFKYLRGVCVSKVSGS